MIDIGNSPVDNGSRQRVPIARLVAVIGGVETHVVSFAANYDSQFGSVWGLARDAIEGTNKEDINTTKEIVVQREKATREPREY